MATRASRLAARATIFASALPGWMLIPPGMTIRVSTLRCNLPMPGANPFLGRENYRNFPSDPAFTEAIVNMLSLAGGLLPITVARGILPALPIDMPMRGRRIVRILVIAPVFVMPPFRRGSGRPCSSIR